MLKPIDPAQINENVFSLIGKQWMLITAGTPQRLNTMTASWGGLGVLWNKPVATCYIRPQRYTYEFVEENPDFTLSFFHPQYREALALCGAKSGRDVDKVKECGFTVAAGVGDAPYVQQANLVLVCKKLYWQDIDPAQFCAEELGDIYPQRDYHRMYIGEIVEALRAEGQ